MISNKYKCVFVEVPKTGSTSIREILGYPKQPHLDINEIKNHFFDESLKNRYGKFFDFFEKSKVSKKWNSYYKFGFVRNPWDRVVSLYFRKEGIQLSNEMSFSDFVNWIQNSSDTSIHASVHKNQLDWFLNEKGEIAVDFIGKFENLEDNWNTICRVLNIKEKLPHKNKNQEGRKHYTEYYDENTKNIIYDKFKTDIKYFNYSFGDK